MKKVFFSWSAASRQNRDYLLACLQSAAATVGDFEVMPAARGPEQADAESTLKAINDCDVFIADVSAEVHAFQERRLYDENVLYEVGYAARAHGPGAIRLVANSATTTQQTQLPFQLQKHRTLLTRYDAANQEGLMRLFVDLLVKHEDAHTGPHPYIYLTNISYSPVSGMKVNVRNGESSLFYLESMEIGGLKGTVNRSLRPHAVTDDLHVDGITSSTYSDPIDVFSFIVFQPGVKGGKYKVYQKLNMTHTDLDQYVIESFDSKPLRVERVS